MDFNGSSTVLTLISLVPTILTVIGLVITAALAIARRSKLGSGASTFAIAGCAVLILTEIIIVIWNHFGINMAVREFDYSNIHELLTIVNLVFQAMWIVGIGLLIAAIFTRRPAPAAPQLPPAPAGYQIPPAI